MQKHRKFPNLALSKREAENGKKSHLTELFITSGDEGLFFTKSYIQKKRELCQKYLVAEYLGIAHYFVVDCNIMH